MLVSESVSASMSGSDILQNNTHLVAIPEAKGRLCAEQCLEELGSGVYFPVGLQCEEHLCNNARFLFAFPQGFQYL